MSAEILLLVGRGMLAASAAILVVLALRGPVRRLFGARIAYGFWLLAPAALIASYLPARVISAPAVQAAAKAPGSAAEPIAEASPVLAQAPPAHSFLPALEFGDIARALSEIAPVLLFVWMTGIVLSLLLVVFDQKRTLARLNLRREGGLYRASGESDGPAIIGVLAPKIVVPADFEQRYSETERALVLAHENAHLHARDAQINGLAALALCLNWFNPLFYWARSSLRIDQELACDEAVMQRHGGARRAYAEAMLKTQLASRAIPLGCQWPALGAGALKQRISMLGRPHPTPGRRALGVGACFLAVAGAGVAVWAVQPPQFASAQTSSQTSESANGADRTDRTRVVSGALGSQLVEALQEGDRIHAQELIEAGADVNYFRRGDGTPLIMAVRLNDTAMASTLIGAGADVNGPAPGDGSPLIVAAALGSVDMIALLVRSGAEVDAIVPGDETPLINAARDDRLDAARYLIGQGADVNLDVEAPTINGVERRSPISMARRGGHDEMIRLLREHGASG